MDTSRRAVESYWRSRMIDGVTVDEDKIAPVYKLEEICELLRTSHASIVKEVSEFILKRLEHKSPIVKQKALRLVKYAVVKSGAEFRREMQRNSAAVRQLLHYKGNLDPLKGDALNKAVRDTAQEAISALFSSDDNKAAAAPAESINKRIEGFGNTNYEVPTEEKKSFLSEVVGLGSASIIQGITSLAVSHALKKNDSGTYRSPNLRRSLTTEIDSRDTYEPVDEHHGEKRQPSGSLRSAASGSWNPDSRNNLMSTSVNDENSSSHMVVKSREERLLETIVSSGGVRLQPTRDALQAFLAEASKLDPLAMSRSIEMKLQSHLWQVRMKAICVLESILRKQDDDYCSIIESYFSENNDAVVKCCELPQASLREKANKQEWATKLNEGSSWELGQQQTGSKIGNRRQGDAGGGGWAGRWAGAAGRGQRKRFDEVVSEQVGDDASRANQTDGNFPNLGFPIWKEFEIRNLNFKYDGVVERGPVVEGWRPVAWPSKEAGEAAGGGSPGVASGGLMGAVEEFGRKRVWLGQRDQQQSIKRQGQKRRQQKEAKAGKQAEQKNKQRQNKGQHKKHQQAEKEAAGRRIKRKKKEEGKAKKRDSTQQTTKKQRQSGTRNKCVRGSSKKSPITQDQESKTTTTHRKSESTSTTNHRAEGAESSQHSTVEADRVTNNQKEGITTSNHRKQVRDIQTNTHTPPTSNHSIPQRSSRKEKPSTTQKKTKVNIQSHKNRQERAHPPPQSHRRIRSKRKETKKSKASNKRGKSTEGRQEKDNHRQEEFSKQQSKNKEEAQDRKATGIRFSRFQRDQQEGTEQKAKRARKGQKDEKRADKSFQQQNRREQRKAQKQKKSRRQNTKTKKERKTKSHKKQGSEAKGRQGSTGTVTEQEKEQPQKHQATDTKHRQKQKEIKRTQGKDQQQSDRQNRKQHKTQKRQTQKHKQDTAGNSTAQQKQRKREQNKKQPERTNKIKEGQEISQDFRASIQNRQRKSKDHRKGTAASQRGQKKGNKTAKKEQTRSEAKEKKKARQQAQRAEKRTRHKNSDTIKQERAHTRTKEQQAVQQQESKSHKTGRKAGKRKQTDTQARRGAGTEKKENRKNKQTDNKHKAAGHIHQEEKGTDKSTTNKKGRQKHQRRTEKQEQTKAEEQTTTKSTA
ncbi:hypothetical protein KFK09_005440 [Dendrobium nobile]|uniref:VHS domain-containing protein n=1 Tax=Dendrobium nobile TaxID=94219 RepID=A0A8T3BVN3_DENNO|nr:hypothetical protein KFK09_005440 [Dendrobium nobile]